MLKSSEKLDYKNTSQYVCSMNKAANTRMHILEKAFDMIYQNGYQATSVDKIIEKTQVTKGAFYYHFKNKDEMGIAIIREIIRPTLNKGLLEPLKHSQNPLEDIYASISNKILKDDEYYVENGCPTNNLVQEMSAVSLKFHKALRNVLDNWISTIEKALERGKANGKVRESLDTKAAARFIVSGYEGMKGVGKIYGKDLYNSYLRELKNYLKTLE